MVVVGALVGILTIEAIVFGVGQALPILEQTNVGPVNAQLLGSAHFTLIARMQTVVVAPNITFDAWTYNGTLPGPVIRVTQGQNVSITLVNEDIMGHSVDFHAAQVPWDVYYKTIPPNSTFTFSFIPKYPGVFMYHCGTPPVLQHISKGMYGIIIVDPVVPRPPAREFVIAQSEIYDSYEDALAVKPHFVVFNGYANRYSSAPLQVKAGELVRVYFVNEGPTLFSAFHVIGAIFDRVYPDGNPDNVLKGIQTWTVPPGGGAVFELTFPEPGQYPFVTHSFAYTGLGAVGLFNVSPSEPSPTTPGEGPSTGTQLPSVPADILPGGMDQGKSMYYSPDPVVVVVGVNNTITWTNRDTVPHTVSSKDGLFDSGIIESGASWTFTFSNPGTFDYYCMLHPWMKGRVIVLMPDAGMVH